MFCTVLYIKIVIVLSKLNKGGGMLYNKQMQWKGSHHATKAWQRAITPVGKGGPTRKDVVAEICAVLLWAASIPVVMWLGAAAGF